MHGFIGSISPESSSLANLIGTEDVVGTPVFDLEGRRLGWIDEVMFDRASGRATYAVVADATRANGGEKRPVPWSLLRYVVARGGYEVETDAESFARAPTLPGHGGWSDAELRHRILDYFKRPITV